MRIYLNAVDDKLYVEYILNLLDFYFNKKAKTYNEKGKGLTIKFHSKEIANLINNYLDIYPKKTYNVKIKIPLKDLSLDFKKYFVRGIVDTDGHCTKNGIIILSLTSKNMIWQVSQILIELGIDHETYLVKKNPPEKLQYRLTIPRRYIYDYIKKIGFSNKRKEYAPAGI